MNDEHHKPPALEHSRIDGVAAAAPILAAFAMSAPLMMRMQQGHHGLCGLCQQPIVQGDGVREHYKGHGRCHGRCAMKDEGPQPKRSWKKKRRKQAKEGVHGEGQDDHNHPSS